MVKAWFFVAVATMVFLSWILPILSAFDKFTWNAYKNVPKRDIPIVSHSKPQTYLPRLYKDNEDNNTAV